MPKQTKQDVRAVEKRPTWGRPDIANLISVATMIWPPGEFGHQYFSSFRTNGRSQSLGNAPS